MKALSESVSMAAGKVKEMAKEGAVQLPNAMPKAMPKAAAAPAPSAEKALLLQVTPRRWGRGSACSRA